MLERARIVGTVIVENEATTQRDLSWIMFLPTLISKYTLPTSDEEHAILLPPRCSHPLPLQSSVQILLVQTGLGRTKGGVVDKLVDRRSGCLTG